MSATGSDVVGVVVAALAAATYVIVIRGFVRCDHGGRGGPGGHQGRHDQ